MVKHSAGPWTESHGNETGYRAVDSTQDPLRWYGLAQVVVEMDGSPCPQGEANLRLILAAPALLHALECQAWVGSYYLEDVDFDDFDIEDFLCQMEACQAQILVALESAR